LYAIPWTVQTDDRLRGRAGLAPASTATFSDFSLFARQLFSAALPFLAGGTCVLSSALAAATTPLLAWIIRLFVAFCVLLSGVLHTACCTALCGRVALPYRTRVGLLHRASL
jgi:hypothetical protein